MTTQGTKIGESIIGKADEVAAAAKARLAATFSDEAAQAAAQSARQRLRQLSSQLNSGLPIDPKLLADITVIAGNKLKNGAVTFKQFVDDVASKVGDNVRSYTKDLEEVYRAKMKEFGFADKIDEAGIKSSLLSDINRIRGTLKDADAIKVFDKKFGDIVRDTANPDSERVKAFEKYLEAAKIRGGGSLEKGLADDWKKINSPAVAKPPFGSYAAELPKLRAEAEKLISDITKWGAAHPEIKGVDRIVSRIKADVNKALTKMETGNLEVTAERVQGFKNNLKGAEGEWTKAKSSPAGTEIGRNLKVQGQKFEIDGVSPDGKIITNTKRYNLFGVNDPRLAELKAQAVKTLKVAEANPVDGQVPKVIFDFPDGVTPEVAAELRKVGLNGRFLEVTGLEKPLPRR